MQQLGQLGNSVSDSKVEKLSVIRDMLQLDIEGKQKLLDSLVVDKKKIAEQKTVLQELQDSISEAQKQLKLTNEEKSGALLLLDEGTDLREGYLDSLEKDIKEQERNMEYNHNQIKEAEERYASNMATFDNQLLAYETEQKDEVEKKIALLEESLAKLEEQETNAEFKISGLGAEKHQIEKDIFGLEERHKVLLRDVNELMTEQEHFKKLGINVGERLADIKAAETKLEVLTTSIIKNEDKVAGEKKDMETKAKWLCEKDLRLEKILKAWSKKAEDPAILRLLDNV